MCSITEDNREEIINLFKKELKKIFKKVCSLSKLKRLTIPDEDNKIKQIFEIYEKYRVIIEKWMVSNKKNNVKNTDVSLDRHKIAAAYFCAILKVEPIAFDEKTIINTPKTLTEKQANYLCAYLFGLQVIQYIINTMTINEKGEKLSKEDIKIYEKDIKCPEVHKSEYTEWFIKLVEGMEKHFDYDMKKSYIEKLIFYISHIYFMIDSYSYQFNRAEMYKEEKNGKEKKE